MADEDYSYDGPDFTYQGDYRNDQNSPLYGGDGWINPGAGPTQQPPRMITNDDLGGYSQPTYANPNAGQGSPYSTYSSNWGGDSFPGGGSAPQLTPRGTPPTPARNTQYGGPTLPPPQFQRLTELLSDPSKITSDPAYKFLLDQGQSMLARRAAANKMTDSGKADVDAVQFGQGSAMQYFNQIIQQLLQSGGLDVSKYNASRINYGSGTGPDAGTQGEFASADLIPLVSRMINPQRPQVAMPQRPQYNPGYNGINPNSRPPAPAADDSDFYAQLVDALEG